MHSIIEQKEVEKINDKDLQIIDKEFVDVFELKRINSYSKPYLFAISLFGVIANFISLINGFHIINALGLLMCAAIFGDIMYKKVRFDKFLKQNKDKILKNEDNLLKYSENKENTFDCIVKVKLME